jgi:hypothetical protein
MEELVGAIEQLNFGFVSANKPTLALSTACANSEHLVR